MKVRSRYCEKKNVEVLRSSKNSGCAFIDGGKEYRVRWKGFGSKDDAWVPEKDCQNEWNELKSEDRQKTLS